MKPMRLFLLLCTVSLFQQCTRHSPVSVYEHEHIREASRLESQEDYQAALFVLDEFLRRSKRELDKGVFWHEPFNPFFHALKAGDLALQLGAPEKALGYYMLAYQHGIEGSFLSDRLRLIALWHEDRDQLHCALKVVEEFREVDPLLFHLVADRLARSLISKDHSLASKHFSHCPDYLVLQEWLVSRKESNDSKIKKPFR